MGTRPVAYQPIPTSRQWKAANPQPTMSNYTQHRQQDIGRAIANGKINALLDRSGDVWTFQEYKRHRGVPDETKIYTVTWDGLGTPRAGLSTSTYSQGPSYYRNGTLVQLEGRPDKWTWAVYFLVNGIPPDSQWVPIPSRNPNWTFEPAWVEYDLNLH